MCRLRLRLGNEWITKMDVGGQSEQPDEGDRRKAAFSDALKRAAVKFGIGRYLYRLPQQWCDYDPKKKHFARTPTLPDFALPKPAAKKTEPAAAKKPATVRMPAANETRPSKTNPVLPANGAELQKRLYDYDARLAQRGLCKQGDLVKHVVQVGVQAGFEADLSTWAGPAILLAAEEAKGFEARVRQQTGEPRKEVA